LGKFKEPIIQEKIDGIEYTVDALFDTNSAPIGIIPRIRLKTRENVSDIGMVIKDKKMIRHCERAGRVLEITGVANFQWIKDKKGVYYLIEINPRISGGLQITLAACPQFITSLIKLTLGMKNRQLSYTSSVLTMKYDSVISTKIF
jgi:carbamoyl-phosphate synthase large subunit